MLQHSIKESTENILTDEIFQITKNINHIAIIPDGNRRWAKEKGLNSFEGHCKGIYNVAPILIKYLFDLKINTVTLWLFSTENWNRSKEEVEYLIDLFYNFFNKMFEIAKKYKIKIIHLGRKDRIPSNLKNLIEEIEKLTYLFTEHVLNIALDYSGPDEIERALNKIIINNTISPYNIKDNLDTAGQSFPNPDLVIRSSGEHRLSGFMSMQTAYSELHFSKLHFPDFNICVLNEILKNFGNRNRRFGK
jgi:undecaprenyl diphosphate synthase